MANRTLALVRKMFNFAIERDWLDSNPCQMIKRPAPDRQRQRVLSEEEVRAVWKALDEEHPIIAALFRIWLLTAQRGSEVHGASWEEMDLTTGWWTIPGERSKNGLDHRVPLSPQALRILKDLRNITEKSKSNGSSRAPARLARTSITRRKRSSASSSGQAWSSGGTTCGAPPPV